MMTEEQWSSNNVKTAEFMKQFHRDLDTARIEDARVEGDGVRSTLPIPFWNRNDAQRYPFQEYDTEDTPRRCVMTTVRGEQCSNHGGIRLFSNGDNPTLANFVVCPNHRSQLVAAVHNAVVNDYAPRPSVVARLVVSAENERVREAERRVRLTEEEIQRVVAQRLSAPLYSPKGELDV
jgi:hypothetical protein